MSDYMVNPLTGRTVKIGGATYRELLRQGAMGGAATAADTATQPKDYQKKLEPPPPGFSYRMIFGRTEPQLCKNPKRFSRKDSIELGALSRLTAEGLEHTPENIAQYKREIEQVLMNRVAQREAPIEPVRPQIPQLPVHGRAIGRGKPARPPPVKVSGSRKYYDSQTSEFNSEQEGFQSAKYTSHYDETSDTSDASDDETDYAARQYGPPPNLSRQQSTGLARNGPKPKPVGGLSLNRN